MRKALARELQHPWARVDRDNDRTGTLCNVVRQLALAAPDIEHPFALPDAVDEEVVISGQAVLCVHAAVVVDRAQVHARVRIAVDLEQLAHRLAVVVLGANRAEPEPEEGSPHGVRKEEAQRLQRDAPADPARHAGKGPGLLRHERYPSRRPRSVER